MIPGAFVVLLISLCKGDGHQPIVTTEWAHIQGNLLQFEGKSVAEFLGIPYAKPPTDGLRFQAPQPLDIPSEQDRPTFDATKAPPFCKSTRMPPKSVQVRPPTKIVPESEDCLTLNIWTPSDSLKNGANLRPVLIHIHGGAYMFDGSRPSFKKGDILSAKGDMVVVLIKYRVGVLGCLFADHDDIPGNVNLLDQAMAMEWVHKNIKNFGGDPDQVTLSGLSAGSISVALHFMNPEAQRLFNRIILESGAVSTDLSESVETSKRRFQITAEKIGCWKDNNITATISCVRKADYELLNDAYVASCKDIDDKITLPHCLVDRGVYSQSEADKRLSMGDIPKNKPALVTTMVDEGTVITGSLHIDPQKSMADNIRYLAPAMSPGITPDETETLVKMYLSGIQNDDEYENQRALRMILGDINFQCPSIWFAEKLMKHVPVYTTQFTKFSDHFRTKVLMADGQNDQYGPKHGGDSSFIFGRPLRDKRNFSAADIQTSEIVMKYWIDFVNTGKVDWPAYVSGPKDTVIPFQYEVRSDKVVPFTRLDPRYQFCQVWKQIHYKNGF
ncbi:acetylcholinesterase-1-like [Brevipalpus obovatus]|uniref:acetylcholinesterase-1-like n=1 Tax=Brevipalpus obovatus TaxID=246614 RepID=UPI003D9F6A76